MAQKMNMVIAQSGGPSMVINESLWGAVMAARSKVASKEIGKILGARHGIAGILKGDYIDLRKVGEKKFEAIAATPSSALGSCRLKPTGKDCRRIFQEFKKLNVGYFYYIGGNDSADAARIVAEEAQKEGYPLVCWHIPKTIDNDLRSCDHTPGFGSAARFVASALKGDDLDNRALGGVKIDIIMGRDAGFLTAASALARVRPDDGPHLIYLPEVPFSEAKFVKDVKATIKKYGRCVCAISEGIRGKDGIPIGAKLADGEKDSHGNVQMSGTGALGDALAKLLKAKAGVKRVRADTFGYLQRSFPGIASRQDRNEARGAGLSAVIGSLLEKKAGVFCGTIGIERRKTKRYGVNFVYRPIADAAKFTRSVPKEYIAKNGHDVTPAFIEYARPIVGDLPKCEIF
ncbi:MAG: diphosphate--fructose-6-phosphate 1-phosphotransferase [Kiritimatiellae bacterium]|nr:diphosphate--fructose-6-phosphate 1-phosphotransferase [Kiritimatiellia bacterium]